MPSPFPGMDPYLEGQGFWPDFHAKFINYAQEALADQLPDHYEVRIEERFSLVFVPDPRGKRLQPDVAILHRVASSPRPTAPMGLATLQPVTIPLMTAATERVRETRIEIRRRPGRVLVGVIELLSPSNKEAPGFQEYAEKRLALIAQPVHLVELDLLVGGHRLPMGGPLPPGDYFALVSRADRRPESDVYAWTVRQPLPSIPIPLAAADPDALLDVAGVFTLAFERGRYARSIDYDAPLTISLDPQDRAWATEQAKVRRIEYSVFHAALRRPGLRLRLARAGPPPGGAGGGVRLRRRGLCAGGRAAWEGGRRSRRGGST